MKSFIIYILFIILTQSCIIYGSQKSDIFNQKSSSSQLYEAKENLIQAASDYYNRNITYQQFKKIAKKSIRILGFTQFNNPASFASIDPLFYAAVEGDYPFMHSLLRKSADQNFSNFNLIDVINTMDMSNNPQKQAIISFLEITNSEI